MGNLYTTSTDNASFQCLWQFTTRSVKRLPFISSMWQGITLYLISAILMDVLWYIIMILINIPIITEIEGLFIFYWKFNIFFCEVPFHKYYSLFLHYCFFLTLLWRLHIQEISPLPIMYVTSTFSFSVIL